MRIYTHTQTETVDTGYNMFHRPLSPLRVFGPFIEFNASKFTSDQDAEDINKLITQNTPAYAVNSDYLGYFDRPSLSIEFRIPSENEFTRTREHVTSNIMVDARSRRITEATIRFPEVETTAVELEPLNDFMETIVPDKFRARMDRYAPGTRTFYYPHVHYSTTRRGDEGPLISTQVMGLNQMIKDWYDGIDELKVTD